MQGEDNIAEFLSVTFQDNGFASTDDSNKVSLNLECSLFIQAASVNDFPLVSSIQDGGVINVRKGGQARLRGCNLIRNEASRYGGVATATGGSIIQASSSTFTDNESNLLGGVFFLLDGSTATCIDCIIRGNTALLVEATFMLPQTHSSN
jgi:hypothetical protein